MTQDTPPNTDHQPAPMWRKITTWFVARPLVIGLLVGLILLSAYAAFFAHTPPEQPLQVVHVAEADGHDANAADMGVNDDVVDEVADTAPATPQTSTQQTSAPQTPAVWEYGLIIADTGLQRRFAQAINDNLPDTVGVAVSVYSPNMDDTLKGLNAKGRELWLQLATQATGARMDAGIDAGPLAIQGAEVVGQNRNQVNRQMAMIENQNIRGAYVRSDADVTANTSLWTALAQDIIARNFVILDATLTPVASSLYLGTANGQPNAYMKASIVIDGASPLGPQLNKAASQLADKSAQIITIEGANPAQIDAIAAWIKAQDDKGIRLVPASRFTHL